MPPGSICATVFTVGVALVGISSAPEHRAMLPSREQVLYVTFAEPSAAVAAALAPSNVQGTPTPSQKHQALKRKSCRLQKSGNPASSADAADLATLSSVADERTSYALPVDQLTGPLLAKVELTNDAAKKRCVDGQDAAQLYMHRTCVCCNQMSTRVRSASKVGHHVLKLHCNWSCLSTLEVKASHAVGGLQRDIVLSKGQLHKQ